MVSWSKWSKHCVLTRSAALRPHLPDSKPMSDERLWTMIHRHRNVILKPTTSSGGNGVLQVGVNAEKRYTLHADRTVRTFIGKKGLQSFLRKKLTRSYMIQKRIALAHIDGRPFDLRVMVQRHRGGSWAVTGKLAKVAGRGYIITNTARSRGYVLPLQTALSRTSAHVASHPEMVSRIDRVALRTARQLQQSYPYIRTIGLDMGIDHQGRVWIIEANFSPMLSLFRRLKDKSMYRRITSYK